MPIFRKKRRRIIFPVPLPLPIPLPLPVGYNVHPSPDKQEGEFMLLGILYNGTTGNPEIDYTTE